MMTMVMLSQPTPPVSELDARQLSIMFSQILSRSCLAAIPRLTNSITAWEDWQSQIPGVTMRVSRGPNEQLRSPEEGGGRTIASNNEELVVIAHLVNHDIGICRDDLLLGCQLGALLELKVADRSRQREVSIDTAKVDEATCGCNPRFLAYNPVQRPVSKEVLARQRNTTGSGAPSFCGLWSNDKGFARPFTPSTLRESPALA
jgi:hypothetical protein